MTKTSERWQLPDGIEELLPADAGRLEHVRRQLLDLFAVWGYQFVMPPLLEFTESLLIGLGEDLDLQTFKMIDQATGRMMGIRADITPQAARIDAHSLAVDGPQRLSYAGSVLHAKPTGLKASRAPIKVGAELYGVADVKADVEVVSLMLESLLCLGIDDITLDLGHVGIYSALIKDAGLQETQQQQLFALLQTKSQSELQEWLDQQEIDPGLRRQIALLAELNGDETVLDTAAQLGANEKVGAALADLRYMATQIRNRYPKVSLYFDLSELRGFNYHTGLVFAAFVPGIGRAVANGGRYDQIGAAFGRARPATGFNADLKCLLRLGSQTEQQAQAIIAPAADDVALWELINTLRADGEIVRTDLDGSELASANKWLEKASNGHWQVRER
ncbi:MAG: ATP phosphoribosyltransferase regulatory subunit [Pseudomonadales bacterium]